MHREHDGWRGDSWVAGVLGLLGAIAVPHSAIAQVIPDETLGNERSTVTREQIREIESDRIDGGARRGQNLFHSFEQFDVGEGLGAYFSNPEGVANILSRVTGSDRSEIMGRLGVLGDANLFFMNPNGILFGPNASLDVSGSFVGTTANGIQFGEQGFFSATNPEVPSQLLTVNPSAFFFNQLNPASIENQSVASAGRDPSNSFDTFGLRVPDGNSLLLLGGDVVVNSGGLVALGGQLGIGGLSAPGTVGLLINGNDLGLTFPENTSRADVSLINDAGLIVLAGEGGGVTIQARNLNIIGSSIDAGILGDLGFVDPQAGDIVLNATNAITIADSDSYVFNYINSDAVGGTSGDVTIDARQLSILNGAQVGVINLGGRGNTGNLIVRVSESIDLDGGEEGLFGGLFSLVIAPGIGNSGEISVETQRLNIRNGAVISASTFSTGNVGAINISAEDRIFLDGSGTSSFIVSNVGSETEGNTTGINILTGSLILTDGSRIQANVGGRGNAGPIRISAREEVIVDGATEEDRRSAINANVQSDGNGNSGGIDITTPSLSVTNRAQITATTGGAGNAGNIRINAQDRVFLLNSIIISEVTEGGGVGQGGNIDITTGTLEIRDGSSLLSDTEYQGNAGNITVTARDAVILAGRGPSAGDINDIIPSQITSTVDDTNGSEGVGNGGTITITAGSLSVADGGFISSSTFGQGNAGDIIIDVRGTLSLNEGVISTRVAEAVGNAGDIFIDANDIELSNSSVITSAVRAGGVGNGGDIEVLSRTISLTDGSQISAFVGRQQRDEEGNRITGGQGRGGDLRINASDSITLSGTDENGFSSGLLTLTQQGALGRAGDIYLTTGNLQIADGAIVVASTYNPSRGGDISINASNLEATRGGQIVTSTRSSGNAGLIQLNVSDRILLSGFDPNFDDRQERVEAFISTSEGQFERVSDIINNEGPQSGIFANTVSGSSGEGGRITVAGNALILRNRAEISAATFGAGSAGNITIRDVDRVSLIGSRISTAVEPNAQGQGGNIVMDVGSLNVQGEGSEITASTRGQGRAGLLDITADNVTLTDGGRLITSTSSNQPAGSITLNVEDITTLSNRGSGIFANTRSNSTGDGGNITLSTTDLIIDDRAQISAQSQGTGTAGGVTIQARGEVNLSDRAQISTESQGDNARAGDIVLDVGNTFAATNSDVTTSAANASGGNIRLSASDIRLLGDSDIRTNSAEDGGNITLEAETIVAFDDSDIFASAAAGRGGDITLNTPAFFGNNYQPDASQDADSDNLDSNDRVDINATGGVSSGSIVTPDTSLVQNSLADLPEDAIDTENLIANSCVVRSQEQGGTFIITGPGGLPERPGDLPRSGYPTGTVQPVPEETAPDDDSQSRQPGDPIVEPQGFYQLEDGRMVLSRECL